MVTLVPLLLALAPQTTQWTGSEPLEAPYDHATHGIWLNYYDMMNPTSHPTSGAAWNKLVAEAINSSANVDPWEPDSDEDVRVMAAAIYAVRTNNESYKNFTAAALAACSTNVPPSPPPGGWTWLGYSRNLTAYTIAADVLKMDGTWAAKPWASNVILFDEWLHDILDGTIMFEANNPNEIAALGTPRKILPFGSGSNASAQEGLCHAAMSAYFREYDRLEYAWQRFRVYLGDRPYTVNNTYSPVVGVIKFDQGIASGWAGSQPSGCPAPYPPGSESPVNHAVVLGCVNAPFPQSWYGAGIICNDMRRDGNEPAQWPPLAYTSYPWTGLEGLIPAAHIFHRFGYDALNLQGGVPARAVEVMGVYSTMLSQPLTSTGPDAWWDYDRAENIKHLFSFHYDEANPGSFPYNTPVGMNKTVGFTDWTHPL